MSANQLQQAVVERLANDPDVLAITGAGRIFDRLITRAEPPYLVLGEIISTDFSTGDSDASEHRFEIEAWSKDNGRREAVELADAVRAALHDADLTLAGAVLVNLRHVRTTSRRAPKTGLHVARLRFRAVTEP
ncbi:DUF3168 domain-containing protein [Hoeflea alexandrii]|uniref:DUF3168 domain-containing protein n=1 Tax=Hoeflea alexandrii TaxID=288436 RepID=A0ABT1CUR2_9HYPH|nr:DUF3168 domain-containing protein [Hoeflea alexandrii]MCO6409903.1 DUF3168 domain-containing protein [Hoeflea alexandrii]MCY0152904.1 DUF3168 domain-containing protein [Hoeflea alexandrii]